MSNWCLNYSKAFKLEVPKKRPLRGELKRRIKEALTRGERKLLKEERRQAGEAKHPHATKPISGVGSPGSRGLFWEGRGR